MVAKSCKQFTKEEYQKVREAAKTDPVFKSLLAVMTHMGKEDESNNRDAEATSEGVPKHKTAV